MMKKMRNMDPRPRTNIRMFGMLRDTPEHGLDAEHDREYRGSLPDGRHGWRLSSTNRSSTMAIEIGLMLGGYAVLTWAVTRLVAKRRGAAEDSSE